MSDNTLKTLILSLITGVGLACGASSPTPTAAEPSAAPASGSAEPEPAGITFADQVEKGAELYAEYCSTCHGDSGEGGRKAPAVVGEGVLPLDPPAGAKRDVQFKTALDVFLWVKKTMPADEPGSLSDEEYVAILAFDLKANGVELDKPLDGEVAAGLNLH